MASRTARERALRKRNLVREAEVQRAMLGLQATQIWRGVEPLLTALGLGLKVAEALRGVLAARRRS